jgi:NAD(P)H-hydrate epimerase
MERAAIACSDWYSLKYFNKTSVKIFCGKGNNGGDGLAIARRLCGSKHKVSVYIISGKSKGSPDFEINLHRLKRTSVKVFSLSDERSFPTISKDDIVIDALFGTGLNKTPEGIVLQLIHHINNHPGKVISIDVPSGLYIDKSSKAEKDAAIIHATYTLTFQNQKLAFLMAENESFAGEVVLLDIGLSKEYEEKTDAPFEFVDRDLIKNIFRPRNEFSHKGNYGYACLLAGSYGMMGAAVLSAKACLRSGVGKLTCRICETGYTILQSSVPEAMCTVSGDKFITDAGDCKNFDVIGIGPGIGKHLSHKKLLKDLLTEFKKLLVVDADALNVISENQSLLKFIPTHSIITPHPKEFERLFGKSSSDFERINLAVTKAKELNIFIVLKGHYTFIAAPDGHGYFNSTGNAGMATAGSGDVLTGIITGLLAQKYSPLNACILGVYLHGLAGDIAAENISEEALIAGDIIDHLGSAFKKVI